MKTSKLTGAALDWAVANCERTTPASYNDWRQTWPKYSTDWSQGGPIIEREKIQVFPHNGAPEWCGVTHVPVMVTQGFLLKTAPHPLVAAMRSYVASKLGDEVEIPEELL